MAATQKHKVEREQTSVDAPGRPASVANSRESQARLDAFQYELAQAAHLFDRLDTDLLDNSLEN